MSSMLSRAKKGKSWPNDMSKYVQFMAQKDFAINEALQTESAEKKNLRKEIYGIVQNVKALLRHADVTIPGKADLEISHHYGIEKFYETGITMITVVNREYCKKLIYSLARPEPPRTVSQEERRDICCSSWGSVSCL